MNDERKISLINGKDVNACPRCEGDDYVHKLMLETGKEELLCRGCGCKYAPKTAAEIKQMVLETTGADHE